MKVPTSADLSGKNVDQIAADFQIWEHVGSALWNLRNFAFCLHVAPEKIRKVSWKSPPPPPTHMKGEGRPYSIRANYSVNPQAFVLEATLTISLKKITSEVKFAERKSALLQNNKVWKKFCLLFIYKINR